jgi:tetratricopeptide (TPR) repeat protein
VSRLALCLALCLGAAAPPAPAQSAFQEGVRAYRQGAWANAHRLWLDALESEEPGIDRAGLCYDLGNAAWRLERPLEAVAWYTAAIRLAPRHRDAWANLEFARGKLELAPADRGDLESTLRRLLSILGPAESEWLVVCTALLLAATGATWALRGGALARRTALGSLLFVLIALAPWIHNLWQQDRDPVMVVEPGGSQACSEPRAGAAMLARLEPAEVVERIDASLPGWTRVELDDGTPAWVESKHVFALRR